MKYTAFLCLLEIAVTYCAWLVGGWPMFALAFFALWHARLLKML